MSASSSLQGAPVSVLSQQLLERQGQLLVLQGKLHGVQDTTMRLEEYELHEAQQWQECLVQAEQRVADHHAQVEEQQGLEDAISRAEERMEAMKEARASHLYTEWHRLFSAHLRAGGTLENFSSHVFLREVYDVVPLEELVAKETATTKIQEEIAMIKLRLQNVEDTERKAAAEAAEQAAKCRMLRAELQEQQSTNAGWRAGRLRDSVHKLKLREEQDQHHGEALELEERITRCEEEHSNAVAKAQLWRESAIRMRQQVPHSEARQRMLEEKVEHMVGGSTALRKQVELQQFELSQHRLVKLWSNEANQAGRIGQEHQNEALALLRHSALVRADEQNAEQELQRLWSELGEMHREAAAQKAELSRTCERREAVEKDVLGLRETNAFLDQQRLKTLHELQYSEGVVASPRLKEKLGLSVPALKPPETYAGGLHTQVSLRSSDRSGAL